MSVLEARELQLGYGNGRAIVNGMSLNLCKGKIYSIIGPNGCGKSTLLRALSRQLKPSGGSVLLDGRQLLAMPPKEVARKLSFLSQGQETVQVKVKELIGYGRSPYQSILARNREEDASIVEWAIAATSLESLKDRNVATLSGGERQRAWIAMSLAQKPEVLLLDEPTTYLDICHQMEVLELIRRLNRQYGMTIVMVLHDMNQACQFSDEIMVMKDGCLMAQGEPGRIMTEELLRQVFQVRASIEADEESGKPLCWVKGKIAAEA